VKLRDTGALMSWRNIETLRRCLARFEARDEERFLELVHPDVELVPAIAVVGPDELSYATYKGHDGVRKWFADIERLSDYRVEFNQFTRAADEAVLVTGRVFLVAETEKGSVYDVYYLFGFRDGKVVSLRTYADEKEALEAAALTSPAE
jgi:ketosteroid isomerase-like protein